SVTTTITTPWPTTTSTVATTTTTLPASTTTTLPAPPPTQPTPPPSVPPRVAERTPVSSPARERAELVPPPVQPQPRVEATALLQTAVKPWADVSADGAPQGTTPFKPLVLSAGDHVVRLQHPDYKPLQKKVTLRAGETTKLIVDLSYEAFPK